MLCKDCALFRQRDPETVGLERFIIGRRGCDLEKEQRAFETHVCDQEKKFIPLDKSRAVGKQSSFLI
jgi:hypothetical protein